MERKIIFINGEGRPAHEAQTDKVEDLYMVLGSIADCKSTNEFSCWRLGPDDPGMGDTYWIAITNANAGWIPVALDDNDGDLSSYGRPLRQAISQTGHPMLDGQDGIRYRLGRAGVEIVALANDLLETSAPHYRLLAPLAKMAAIKTAVSEATSWLAADREAALDRLAGTIAYQDFGRGALEYRRRQLEWLLDGMSPEVIFCPN